MKWLFRISSALMAVLFAAPLVWMLVVSIKEEGMKIITVLDWFKPPYSLAVYEEILTTTKLSQWIANSLFVAVIVTVLTVILQQWRGLRYPRSHFAIVPLFSFSSLEAC